MNQSAYDPEAPSTWKERFTMESIQDDGSTRKFLVIFPVAVAIATTQLFIVLRLGTIQPEESILAEYLTSYPWLKLLVFFGIIATTVGSIYYIFNYAITLTKKIYLPPEDTDISKLIKNKLLMPKNTLPGFLKSLPVFPYVIIKDEESIDENHWAHWFGGPVLLVIYDGWAVYVERGNQFSRVLGAGLPPPVLDRYERIKTVIDLRPKDEVSTVNAWTKDGIKVEANVKIKVQTSSSESAKKKSVVLKEEEGKTNLVYPFDPENIKKIVEGTAVFADKEKGLRENNWHAAAMGTVTGVIKAYITGQSMDELITWDEESPQLLSFKVSDQLRQKLKENLAKGGKDLLDLQITDFKPEKDKETEKDEITDKLIEYWKTRKEQEKALVRAEAEAKRILEEQDIQTRAYRNFFQGLLEQLEILFPEGSEDHTESFTEVALIMLSNALSKDVHDPMFGPFTVREILSTFELLREQLNATQNQSNGHRGNNE